MKQTVPRIALLKRLEMPVTVFVIFEHEGGN